MKLLIIFLLLLKIVSAADNRVNYCEIDFFKGIKHEDLSNTRTKIKVSKIKKELREKAIELSKKIYYFEPYNPLYVNNFIDLLNKNKEYDSSFTKVLEYSTLFMYDKDSLKKIKDFYIKNFEEIRKDYLSKPSYIRYLTFKKLNLLSKSDLKIYFSKINHSIPGNIELFETMKLKKHKNYKINCSNIKSLYISRNSYTVLDLTRFFLESENNYDMKLYFYEMARSDNTWYYFIYRKTGSAKFLYEITKNRDLLLEMSKEALAKADIYEAYFLSKKFLDSYKTGVKPNQMKKINEAKKIIVISGETISNNFRQNKDFVSYRRIKAESIKYSKKIFNLL